MKVTAYAVTFICRVGDKGGGLPVEANQKMKLLLSDLGITTETDLFEGGALERLVVNKQRRTWTFHFHMPRVLPYEYYQLFISRLENRYATFADEVYARF